jgi:hypothetical protein
VAQIAKAAGKGDICYRGRFVRSVKHRLGMCQTNAFHKIHWRVSAVPLERKKKAARTDASDQRQRLDSKGLIPVRFDVFFRATNLPRRGNASRPMQEMAEVVVKRAQEGDNHGLFEFRERERMKVRASRIGLLDQKQKHLPQSFGLRAPEVAGMIKYKPARWRLAIQGLKLPGHGVCIDGNNKLLEFGGVIQAHRLRRRTHEGMLTRDLDIGAAARRDSTSPVRKQEGIGRKRRDLVAYARLVATIGKADAVKVATVRYGVEISGAADQFEFGAGVVAIDPGFQNRGVRRPDMIE